MPHVLDTLTGLADHAGLCSVRAFTAGNVLHLTRNCPLARLENERMHPRTLTLGRLVSQRIRACETCAPVTLLSHRLRFGTTTLFDACAWISLARRTVSLPASVSLFCAYQNLIAQLTPVLQLDDEVAALIDVLSQRVEQCVLPSSALEEWLLRHELCGTTPPGPSTDEISETEYALAWRSFTHVPPWELWGVPTRLRTQFEAHLQKKAGTTSVVSVRVDPASPLAPAFPTASLRALSGDVPALCACIDPAAVLEGARTEHDVDHALLSGLLPLLDDALPLSVRVRSVLALLDCRDTDDVSNTMTAMQPVQTPDRGQR